jgi:hypothetical protein
MATCGLFYKFVEIVTHSNYVIKFPSNICQVLWPIQKNINKFMQYALQKNNNNNVQAILTS